MSIIIQFSTFYTYWLNNIKYNLITKIVIITIIIHMIITYYYYSIGVY